MSKYQCGDTVKVINSDTLVVIKGTTGNDYFIGQSWEYETQPKYSYRIGSSLYIKEQYLKDTMQYKIGDTVWYLDNTPLIRKDVVRGVFENPQRYTLESDTGCYYYNQFKLFPTKESLLAAIDPPLHNFVVGQTVWYIEEADDPDTLRIEKATVVSTTNDAVEISISHPCVPNFTIDDLSIIFSSPQDAINKALELKQW